MGVSKEKKIKFTVYETINTINKKKYIGIHKCYDPNDDYLGSGIALSNAIKKYGRSAFEKRILFIFDNEEDALEKEKELITINIIKSDNYYNLTKGGQYYDHHSNPHEPTSVIAINIETGEEKSYPTIAECCRDLNLTPPTVYGVCTGTSTAYSHKGWRFKTEKYGERKLPKRDNIKVYNDKKRGYILYDNKKYITSRKNLDLMEEVVYHYKDTGRVLNNKHLGTEKYIYKRKDGYYFYYKNKKYLGKFNNIEDAIDYRNEYIQEEDKYEK